MGMLETHSPPPPPVKRPREIDARSNTVGLRTVASFEALKGIIVLVLGIALLFVHRHAEDYAVNLLFHLHIDLDRGVSRMLLNAATKFSDARVLTIVLAALTYSSVRFVEGWGLWNRRVWAEWFALLSGALYLPWEILKLVERVDWQRVAVLLINIGIILYMLYIRIRDCGTIMGCREPKI